MPDTDHTNTAERDRVHEIVTQLRRRLADIGLPDDQVRQVIPITDMQRRPHVRLGTFTVASAELLLAALTRPPAAFVGRVDAAPARPQDTP